MSIKVSVYVPTLSEDLVAKIADRFGSFGMECQFHPAFALDAAADSGVVTARLRVRSPQVPQYENVEMLSSFEIEFKDFSYRSPLAVTPTTNEKLKHCTKQVIVRMNSNPTSAVRVGLCFAAFLAELTDGVVYTPRTDKFLMGPQAVAQLTEEITQYEMGVAPQDWSVVQFSSWP